MVLTMKRIAELIRRNLPISLVFIGCILSAGIFILMPLSAVLLEALTTEEGTLTFQKFVNFFKDPWPMECTYISVKVAIIDVLGTSLIGIPLAWILTKTNVPHRRFLRILVLIPLVMPPLTGALGFIYIFGRRGMINVVFQQLFHFKRISFDIYRSIQLPLIGEIPWGICFIHVFHLYPLIYLSTSAALYSIDPRLEESGRVLGESPFKVFRTITLPLMLPGYFTGAILVFLRAFSDIGVPILLGYQKYLSVDIYTKVTSYYDISTGIVECAIMVVGSIMVLMASMKFLSKMTTELIPTRARSTRVGFLTPIRKLVAMTFCSLIICVGSMSTVGIALMAVEKNRSTTVLFTQFSIENFAKVLSELRSVSVVENPVYLSLLYSSIATIISLLFGLAITYILLRTRLPGRAILDIISKVPLVLPGIVFATAYIRFFKFTLPGSNVIVYHDILRTPLGLLCMVPIALAFHRLPYLVGPLYGSFASLGSKLEDASRTLGVGKCRTFFKIVFPLVSPGILAGAVQTFVFCILNLSIYLVLTPPGLYPLTSRIFNVFLYGSFGIAATYSLILIAITFISLAFMTIILQKESSLYS